MLLQPTRSPILDLVYLGEPILVSQVFDIEDEIGKFLYIAARKVQQELPVLLAPW